MCVRVLVKHRRHKKLTKHKITVHMCPTSRSFESLEFTDSRFGTIAEGDVGLIKTARLLFPSERMIEGRLCSIGLMRKDVLRLMPMEES